MKVPIGDNNLSTQKSEDFIRVYDNAVSRQFCQGVIEYFEWCYANNRTWERQEATALVKKDTSSSLNPQNQLDIRFNNEHLSGYIKEFNDAFWNQAYSSYRQEFDSLSNYERHTIVTYKVQKTLPGGGYHIWHCENGTIDTARRIAVYTLYLNDVIGGGETEFLYQHERVEAKEGRLVIFPAGYTHPHRGNPPLKGSKYIMTGWIELN